MVTSNTQSDEFQEQFSIVVVEDEPDLVHLIQLHLKRAGHQVVSFHSAEDCLKVLPDLRPHLVIIDWMLPGMSGLDLCRRVKREYPVILLTARAEAQDVIQGLEVGADDYITKPFEPSVLIARVKALLRRATQRKVQERPSKLQLGNLEMDLDRHTCTNRGEECHLTNMEFRLLTTLVENIGIVLTRDRLIAAVQGLGVAVTDRTIDQHVYRLRKKIGDEGNLIEAVRGVGYRVSEK